MLLYFADLRAYVFQSWHRESGVLVFLYLLFSLLNTVTFPLAFCFHSFYYYHLLSQVVDCDDILSSCVSSSFSNDVILLCIRGNLSPHSSRSLRQYQLLKVVPTAFVPPSAHPFAGLEGCRDTAPLHSRHSRLKAWQALLTLIITTIFARLVVKYFSVNSEIFALNWVQLINISSHNEYFSYLLVYLEYLILLDSIHFTLLSARFSPTPLLLFLCMLLWK